MKVWGKRNSIKSNKSKSHPFRNSDIPEYTKTFHQKCSMHEMLCFRPQKVKVNQLLLIHSEYSKINTMQGSHKVFMNLKTTEEILYRTGRYTIKTPE